MRSHVVHLLAAVTIVSACRTAMPPIRFAPPGTDSTRLRAEYPLSDAERLALTPDNVRTLSQDQVDQIYVRLSAGPVPDGPFRGDLFFPRDRSGSARVGDLPVPDRLAGTEGLNIRDEIRLVRRGFYLGRAYFGERFALNFTLLDPASAPSTPDSVNVQEDCV